MADHYELSTRLLKIANDLARAGFEAWPDDLQELSVKAQALENRFWARDAREGSVACRCCGGSGIEPDGD